ncbi:MAG: radical SAM protein [Pyrinomonadaceae bacterium]
MKKTDVFRAWARILGGYYPSLSIEITRECPLRCPGCYAYELSHLGEAGPLRQLSDFSGQELITGVLNLVRQYRPLHISVVGGEPLVRFRELNTLLPLLSRMNVAVQLVTSAVRRIPPEWATIRELYLVVSIDGLQPEHDVRRAPATYARILKNIEGHSITVHCTITRQMTGRSGYFEEFVSFWSSRPEVKKIWFSFFTPQVGTEADEVLSRTEMTTILNELHSLRTLYSKLYLPDTLIVAYNHPPQSPSECIFARTTLNLSADLQTKVTPCQFGGIPDCTRCGCIASAGLKAVADHRLMKLLPLSVLYNASDSIGKRFSKHRQYGPPD